LTHCHTSIVHKVFINTMKEKDEGRNLKEGIIILEKTVVKID
jgi:hypothetical protein